MSSKAGAIEAGRAFYKLGVDRKELDQGLTGAVKGVKAMAASMAAAGAQLAAIGAAMFAPLKKSLDLFAGYEKSMARVRAITNASSTDFGMLGDEARRLGRDTVFMAQDAANAMSFMALAGFKPGEIMQLAGPALDLAAVGMMDVAQATDIAVKVVRGMGLETEEAAHAVDLLAAAMTTANTDLVQLGEALKYVGPIAKTAGVSLETTTAAIQLMSNAGIQGSMAGTSLRAILLRIVKGSGASASALKALAGDVMDTHGNLIPLADILDRINTSFDGLGDAQKLSKLGEIFPNRAAAGMAVLVGKGGDELRKFEDALKDAGGTGKRIAATQLNTVWGAFKLLSSSVEGVGINIGEALMPAVRVVVGHLVDAANAASTWVSQNRAAVMGFAALATALTTAGAALTATGLAMLAVTSIGGSLASMVGTAWALSWNHWVMAIGKAAVILAEIPAVERLVYDALANLISRFVSAANTITDTWNGMKEVLDFGDLATAGEIGILGIKTAWLENTADMRTAWTDFMAWLNATWIYIAAPFELIMHEFLRALNSVFGGTINLPKMAVSTHPLSSLDIDHPIDPSAPFWVQDRNTKLNEIRAQRRLDQAENDRAAGEARAQLDKQLARTNALRETRTAREASESALAGFLKEHPGLEIKAPRMAQMSLADKGLKEAIMRMESKGTFTAGILAQMGGGSAQERTAKASEEMLGVNKDIRDLLKDLDIDEGGFN